MIDIQSTRTLIPVVYTMGKVASTAISQAIIAAGLPCTDVHTLNRAQLMRRVFGTVARGHIPQRHLRDALWSQRKLTRQKHRYLYISLVRDPIARNLSAYFENRHFLSAHDRQITDPHQVLAHFHATYTHRQPLTWFAREFETQLGIDVYAQAFPQQQKFSYDAATNTVIFRTDCPDATKSAVLSQLLARDITVGRSNLGTQSDYHALYAQVQATASFDPTFVQQTYDTRFARHFWTAPERAAFVASWSHLGRV